MNDRELEEILKEGKKESECFFSNWSFSPLREVVKMRIHSSSSSNRSTKCATGFNWFSAGKLATGAVCVLILLVIFLLSSSFFRLGPEESLKTTDMPIAQQMVSLDDSDTVYLVNFLPVNKPNRKDYNLLALVWRENPQGDTEMVYSSLLEDSDEPYPVSTIRFAGTGNKLVLISSGDSRKNYLHYRLIGCSNDSIKTFWAQDFVPNGKLGIKEGILVEQRVSNEIPFDQKGKDNTNTPRKLVTYIIPYKINNLGELILPADKIQMRVGEQILLIGDSNEKDFKVLSVNNIVKKVDQGYPTDEGGLSSAFYAKQKGEDILLLAPDGDNSKAKPFRVKVVD